MGRKVLVAYASRTGSTAEVAQTIADELRKQGADVEVRLAKKVRNVRHYDAVIVGGPIRFGKWLPEAEKFVATHQEDLRERSVGVFALALTMREDSLASRAQVRSGLVPIFEMVPPVHLGLFGGVLDCHKLSPLVRRMMQSSGIPEKDHRDWAVIRNWATELYMLLQEPAHSHTPQDVPMEPQLTPQPAYQWPVAVQA
jgi:menaquinone-dependent protoporphyrinogen oxidase